MEITDMNKDANYSDNNPYHNMFHNINVYRYSQPKLYKVPFEVPSRRVLRLDAVLQVLPNIRVPPRVSVPTSKLCSYTNKVAPRPQPCYQICG